MHLLTQASLSVYVHINIASERLYLMAEEKCSIEYINMKVAAYIAIMDLLFSENPIVFWNY